MRHPDYFERHGIPRQPEDLARHNCLAFNLAGGQQRGWTFQRDGRLFAVRVEGDLACNDGELLYGWVKQGLGVGWRSTWEIQAELKRGELVTVLDEFAVPSYDIQAVYPQQRHLPAKVRRFIEHLRASCTGGGIGEENGEERGEERGEEWAGNQGRGRQDCSSRRHRFGEPLRRVPSGTPRRVIRPSGMVGGSGCSAGAQADADLSIGHQHLRAVADEVVAGGPVRG